MSFQYYIVPETKINRRHFKGTWERAAHGSPCNSSRTDRIKEIKGRRKEGRKREMEL